MRPKNWISKMALGAASLPLWCGVARDASAGGWIQVAIAQAEVTASGVAATCTVSEEATQGGLHDIGNGWIQFAPGKTGLFRITCPIDVPFAFRGNVRPTGFADSNRPILLSRIQVHFTDPDGSGGGASVQAILRRFDRSTGALATLSNLHSNSQAATGYTSLSEDLGNQAFVPSATYFLEVVLARSSTSVNPRFYAFALTGTEQDLFGVSSVYVE